MKLNRIILFAAAVFMAAGLCSCTKDGDKSTSLSGEWHLVSDTDGIVESGEVDVYISFTENSFELFQKSGTAMRYSRYSGNYTLTDGLLSGEYSGGSSWGSDYTVTVDKGNVMVMSSTSTGLTCTYERTGIPESVRSGAIDTRSASPATEIPFL